MPSHDLVQRARETSRGEIFEIPPETPKEAYDVDAIMVPADHLFLNPRNARSHFNPVVVADIAASIKSHGLLQPLLVRLAPWQRVSFTAYEIIAGDSRYLGAKEAGYSPIPCRVRDVDDATARRMNLVENLHREALNAVDLGKALESLRADMQAQLDRWMEAAVPTPKDKLTPRKVDAMLKEYAEAEPWIVEAVEHGKSVGRLPKVTWAVLGRQIGLSERRMGELVKIASVAEDVQERIVSGEISGRQARAISLLDDPKQQRALAREVIKKKLSGDAATQRAQEIAGRPVLGKVQPAPDPVACLRQAVSLTTAAVTLLESGRFSELFGQEVRREVELLEAQIGRLREAVGQGAPGQ